MWWDDDVKNVRVDANVSVTENRAPTDESVRLLKEMQEKATKDIVASIALNDNKLSAACIVVSRDMLNLSHDVHGRFILNGKEYTFTHKMKADMFASKDELVRLLIQNVSEQVAIEMLKESWDNINYNLRSYS